tara:strand:- start:22 stop:429 length:408 start_codon:yes stop_codon:yes gene_type:complete
MTTYKDITDIQRVAAKYYNDKSFCTVVALAIAAGIGFGKAFHTYRKLGRRRGTGTYRPMQEQALAKFGLKLEPVPNNFGCKTTKAVGKIAHKLQGIFWVHCTGHVGCIRDGHYYDQAAKRNKRNIIISRVVPINN